MVKFPECSKRLIGGTIKILNPKGADWIRTGQQFLVKNACTNKLFFEDRWWRCGDNRITNAFEVVKMPPGKVFLSSPITMLSPKLMGMKVQRGPSWGFDDQDNNSVYGLIIRVPNSGREGWISVKWLQNDGRWTGDYSYRVCSSTPDLAFYSKIKQMDPYPPKDQKGERAKSLLEEMAREEMARGMNFQTTIIDWPQTRRATRAPEEQASIDALRRRVTQVRGEFPMDNGDVIPPMPTEQPRAARTTRRRPSDLSDV